MSSEEFWKDDPQLFVSYRTSFINKKKREMEEWDYKCWLQGLYNYKGNIITEELLRGTLVNMFASKKQNFELDTYPEKPFGELEKEKKTEKTTKKEKYDNFQSSLYYFGSMKQRYREQIENEVKIYG